MKKKQNTFKDYLKDKVKNKTFRKAYEHYNQVLDIGLQVRELRESAGLTQATGHQLRLEFEPA